MIKNIRNERNWRKISDQLLGLTKQKTGRKKKKKTGDFLKGNIEIVTIHTQLIFIKYTKKYKLKLHTIHLPHPSEW